MDHDVIDGAPVARFTQRLKELIESGYGLSVTQSFDKLKITIGHLTREKIEQMSNRKTLQMPDASGEVMFYTESKQIVVAQEEC